MRAASLERAKRLAKEFIKLFQYGNECNIGILVGGMSASKLNLRRHEIHQIQNCCVADTDYSADAFLSLFKPLQGACGMLHRAGEHVLSDDSNPESVAKLEKFFCQH